MRLKARITPALDRASREWPVNWDDFGRAFALYLILEGLLPFFSPLLFKQALQSGLQASDGQLRLIAALAIIIGLGLLHGLRGSAA